MANTELMPCAHCGEKLALGVREAASGYHPHWWQVYCGICSIQTARIVSREGAIAAWNRRAPVAEGGGSAGAVRDICNAMEYSPGCLYPNCDCKKLPQAIIAALDRSGAQVEEMARALEEIARQRTTAELEGELDGCDFDYAYDKMIEVDAALSSHRANTEEQKR